ncbi:serine hydrolase domain-containing protein [Pontibacter sp. G13]|uniref:serine hydrolase domain-containing protein n=1 Tax=Pontibacter sp. G13 TaxID=3074898 RepID=UPI00288C49EC|nr:serine hydrolase domain-containing protein [Pontibacter sp. G13]WNJ17112.1 serine hydrolase domain-containing protein [Pontibacter sp. G13]
MLLIGCTHSPDIQRLDGSSIDPEALDAQVRRLMEEASVTGLGITVFNRTQPVYQRAYGYADAETQDSLQIEDVIYGASFSKAVFGYLVAQLADSGLIDLDTPLQSYLDIPIPELPLDKEYRRLDALASDDRYKQITARMCLSHTTGLPNWRWIEDDKQLKYLYNPGERYNYSGEGMMILQWVIEEITGQSLEDLADERVFIPLRMERSSYLWKPEFEDHVCFGHQDGHRKIPRRRESEEAGAAGSLETTLADYSRFLTHILTLESQGSPITQLMFSPNIRIRSQAQFGPLSHRDTTAHDEIELSYGLGWGLLQSTYGPGVFKEGHDDGFQHYSILFPAQELGIVIMTNSDNGESIFKELLEMAIGDTFTPWRWEHYIPYQMK